MFITLPNRWPELGDIYLLDNGIKCIFDYSDGLQYGVSQSDGKRWGNNYLMGVTEWLKINKAVLLGNSQELLRMFDKRDISENEWMKLNDFETSEQRN